MTLLTGLFRFGTIAFTLALIHLPLFAADVEQSTQDEFSEFEDEFGEGAEGVTSMKVFDPFIGYNRIMYNVNDKIYFWILKPAAKGYDKVMPEFAQSAIGRAFQNIGFPNRFASSLLQFKFKKVGTELGRFIVNSSLGIGGLFDPAGKYLKWHECNEDLGQMLGWYRVGDGFPIVLPILGQTNLRDSITMISANWLSPLAYVTDFRTNLMIRSSERFNNISLRMGQYERIKKDALDPYTFIRDSYKRRRDQDIKE